MSMSGDNGLRVKKKGLGKKTEPSLRGRGESSPAGRLLYLFIGGGPTEPPTIRASVVDHIRAVPLHSASYALGRGIDRRRGQVAVN